VYTYIVYVHIMRQLHVSFNHELDSSLYELDSSLHLYKQDSNLLMNSLYQLDSSLLMN